MMLNNLYKKNKTTLQQLYGRPIVTRTLCNEVKSDAKIQINPQTAKQNLQNLKTLLSTNPTRLKSLRGLNTDICKALGIDNNNASKYGDFIADGFECSIGVSNHNSNANTYDINLNNNISIKIRPRTNSNSFVPSKNVTLEEFTYFDTMINQDNTLVFDIIDSLIEYLSTGEYVDKSGLAKKNYSPDLQTISQQRIQQTLQRKDNEDYINLTHMGESKRYKNNQINCNKNMNRNRKNVVRLTESKLREMIKESVRQALRENKYYKSKRKLTEAGQIYFKDDEGNIHTNSRQTYRGVPGSIFISHGEWADPEIIWKGHSINAEDIEESLWQAYKDYGYKEAGQEEPTEQGFDEWIENQDKRWIESCLDDLVWSLDGCP